MSFGMLYLGDAVAQFMARYPELRIELVLSDRFIDPLEEGVDVTVRIGALGFEPHRAAPGSSAARTWRLRRHTSRGTAPADAAGSGAHRCLAYGHWRPCTAGS